MPFEEFRQKGGRAKFGFPAITLMRSGGIALNRLAYDDLGRPTRVVLAYDRETTRIGIRASDGSEDFAYPVRQLGEDSWAVAGKSFVRYFGIAVNRTTRHRAAMDGNYMTIDLREKPVHEERERGEGIHQLGVSPGATAGGKTGASSV